MPIKHSFVSSKADGADTSLVRPSDWNADHILDGSLTMDATTAPSAVSGKGQLYVKTDGGVTKLYFKGDDGTEHGPFQGSVSGSNTGDQTITLTGDVTGSGTGSFAATIANDAVTYAKIQNVSATDKLLGRSSAGAGDIEEITCTSFARTLLDDADASTARSTLGAFELPSLTSGSVLFSNGTTIAQDNANLFWDDTNNRLGIGTSSPSARLNVVRIGEQLRLNYDSGNYASFEKTSSGQLTVNLEGGSSGRSLRITGTNPSVSVVGDSNSYYTVFSVRDMNGGVYLSPRYNLDAASLISTKAISFVAGSSFDFGGTPNMHLNTSGNLGIGTGSYPGARLHSISATQQLRLGYDGSNYAGFTVTSAGQLNLASTGTTRGIQIESSGGRLGFYGTTPISRPTTGSASATFTANTGTAVNDASTFDGYTLKQIVKALRDFGLLA
ncbi:MAG: hypothetical protein ACO24B_01600 [Ilumatobacteraceae bacterium]